MNLPRLRAFALIAVAVLVLSACGARKPDEPQPARLDLAILAGADINPDADGRPSPLLIRLYALRAKDGFAAADFFSLFEKDEQMLAADLAKREEFILQPGQTLTLPREYAPDVTFVGVMAAYRDVERSTWRGLLAVPPGANGVLAVSAGANSIELSLEASGKEE
ncbi:type VI secretion system lipoprotein TssJ [Panacagrimonas sp.]|uniref:type VI secretion system lipoprotein TssJ n=1 Tax=Panacagrimonas sp. TaxID=2480088 RepID=UPI003B516985